MLIISRCCKQVVRWQTVEGAFVLPGLGIFGGVLDESFTLLRFFPNLGRPIGC